jgi:hypothetical protein
MPINALHWAIHTSSFTDLSPGTLDNSIDADCQKPRRVHILSVELKLFSVHCNINELRLQE